MHKLRIGIVSDQFLKKDSGGAFSYYSSLLNGLNNYNFDDSIELVNIIFYNKNKPTVELNKPCIFINGLVQSEIKQKIDKKLVGFKLLKNVPFLKKVYNNIKQKGIARIIHLLEEEKIDLLYYLTPIAYKIDFPYIITHWDLAHKSTYAFPEISMNGNYEFREAYYSPILNKALMILCESETSIKELKSLFSIDQKKIELFPIFGNKLLSIMVTEENTKNQLLKFQLQKEAFFLYPAQFWSLKNHYNLILAFDQFLKQDSAYQKYKLVLCGSDKGNLIYIKEVIRTLNLENSIVITGFIENEELHSLYKSAAAMVFPAFLGPTNMPIIEAAEIGCPVICSDIEGHREILHDYAIYFDPTDYIQLSNAMMSIVNDRDFRQKLISDAKIHITNSKFNLENSLVLLNKTLLKLKAIRKTWGINSAINSNV